MKKILVLVLIGVVLISSFSVATAANKKIISDKHVENKKIDSRFVFLNLYQKNGFIDTIIQKLRSLLSRLLELISQKSDTNNDDTDTNSNNNDNTNTDDKENEDNKPEVNLAFEKRVRKKGSNIWEKQVSIKIGEEVEFGLTIYNLNDLLRNCGEIKGVITDVLPPYLLYTKDSAYFLIGKGETWIYAGQLRPLDAKPSISADKGENITFIYAPLEKTSLIESKIFSDATEQMPDWEHGMIVFSSKAIQTGEGINTADLKAFFDGTQVELQDIATVTIS